MLVIPYRKYVYCVLSGATTRHTMPTGYSYNGYVTNQTQGTVQVERVCLATLALLALNETRRRQRSPRSECVYKLKGTRGGWCGYQRVSNTEAVTLQKQQHCSLSFSSAKCIPPVLSPSIGLKIEAAAKM